MRNFGYYDGTSEYDDVDEDGNPLFDYDSLIEEADPMIEFFRSADDLETLAIEKKLASIQLSQAPFNFQLKKLKLKLYDLFYIMDEVNEANKENNPFLGGYMTPELPGFLASQHNSLTHLTIENSVLHSSDLSAILGLKIKYLEIGCYWFYLVARWPFHNNAPGPENKTIQQFVFQRFRDDEAFEEWHVWDEDVIDFVLSNCTLRELKLERCKDLYSKKRHTTKELEELMHLIVLNPKLQKISMLTSYQDEDAFGLIREKFNEVVEYK